MRNNHRAVSSGSTFRLTEGGCAATDEPYQWLVGEVIAMDGGAPIALGLALALCALSDMVGACGGRGA